MICPSCRIYHTSRRHPSLRGALATKQSILSSPRNGLLRGACHRARIRATRWLAMTDRLARWRRQKVDVVLGGKLDHDVRVLLLQIVDGPEQLVEPAGGGHPEQRLGELLRL